MIGLDTNVLARYYIDAEAQRQRLAVQRLIESGQPLMVSKSVVLELESVMRGYYGFAQADVASVLRHLFEQAHITVEDRDAIEQALSNCGAGIDLADALHHASYKACDSVAIADSTSTLCHSFQFLDDGECCPCGRNRPSFLGCARRGTFWGTFKQCQPLKPSFDKPCSP